MSSNRHNPPGGLSPQERRWLAQAAKKRGVVYQPWPEHAERQKREETAIFHVCAGEGCNILIRANNRDKYCARCKAAEHDRKAAARNKVRKEKYRAPAVTTSAAENERAREAARRKREQEREAA